MVRDSVYYYNSFVHTLLKFPNTNIFIKAFTEQREYEEIFFKISWSESMCYINKKKQ